VLVRFALVAVVAACVLLAGWWGWRLWYSPSSTLPSGAVVSGLPSSLAPSDLNLLVVTLDTTRADRIGAYGYGGGSTPNIDRIAAEGVIFENTQAVAPLTLPTHCTILTGLWPPAHGVRDNGGFVLSDRNQTLATILRSRGYATGAFVGAFVLDSKWGLDQGFDKYYDKFDIGKTKVRSMGDIARPANEVIDQALPWLQEHETSKFFAWIHLYDPHAPYDPPEPYRTEYARRPYVGEIAFADGQLARVIEWLSSTGLLDRTVVVIIGDHGESLGEHGEATHAFFIYEASLRVPFIMRTPYASMTGRRVRTLARQVDVFPTVLDLLGVETPEHVQGESLVELMVGAQADDERRESYAESYYPRYHFGWSELRALHSGRYKYIDAPRPELYDLQHDPHELTNLAEDRPSIVGAMAKRLGALEQAVTTTETRDAAHREVDAETRAQLAALGYIGSFAPDTRPGKQLADPKDRIGLFNMLNSARERLTDEEPDIDAAIKMLREIITQDPTVIDAWTTLGNAYGRQGDYEQAIVALQKALELNPTYDVAVIELARAYRAIDKPREALTAYELYLKSDPKDAGVHYQMAQTYLDLGDLASAERACHQVLELDPMIAAAQVDLGVIHYKRGRVDEALRAFDAALKVKAEVRLAHFNLGRIAEDRGDLPRAMAEYRQEIELHVDSYQAHFQLGRVLDLQGQREEAVSEYEAAVTANPRFGEGYLLLAKTALDAGNISRAIERAKEGLKLSPASEFAPLGHYVLADAYNRQGRHDEAAREAAIGRALEAQIPSGGSESRIP
jgi:arylsulfatase A-like enzyme/Flp pilus assembly protein TadD